MSEITRGEVAHLARLARLALEDEELDRLAGQLDVILGAVAKIGEVSDAEGVQPMTHAVPLENVMRPDVVVASLPRDDVLAGAPAAEDGRFRVPRILDDDS
jgi:aspartyl-tRNA(Asn)/glutamyl-tRNA(Gln) amidotransferase subunit C